MKVDHKQLNFIDNKLSTILDWMEEYYGVEFTGTSIYRPGDNGVHGTLPVRGWDVRWKDAETGYLIAKRVNERYQYDPSRPDLKCCIYHDVGQGAHLHVQVHPQTKVL